MRIRLALQAIGETDNGVQVEDEAEKPDKRL
jgi:hypothetical protein